MPISLPTGLPAGQALAAEGIEVLTGDERHGERGHPLRICLVNLMPNKTATETQICRLLAASSIPVAVTLCVPDSYRSKTTPESHIATFYQRWSQIRDEGFDGLIVTGAPIETLPFEAVSYWPDLTAMIDWARARIASSLYICWAAQAALYHVHGVPKHPCPAKISGVFRQRVVNAGSRLLRGLGDEFPAPVSRHTEVRAADLPTLAGLTVLAESIDAGLCLVEDRENRAIYMFNHLEYDAGTLRDEFLRDRLAGKCVDVPSNYFPGDDPARPPPNIWRPSANVLFGNWLGEIQRQPAAPGDGCGTAWRQRVPAPPNGLLDDRRRRAKPSAKDPPVRLDEKLPF